MIKKTKQEIEIDILNNQLNCEKEKHRRYIGVLKKYALENMAFSSVYFEDLKLENLKKMYENIDKSEIREKEKKNMRMGMLFGFDKSITESDKINESIRYYKTNNSFAKSVLNDLDDETKTKIVEDGLEQTTSWCYQFDVLSKIIKKIDELTKAKKRNK